jgi:hypothetical protein
MRNTVDFQTQFGRDYIKYDGLLILGRDEYLGYQEQMRLAWRFDKVLVNSKKIICVTFDKLYEDLDKRLRSYQAAFLPDDRKT